MYFPLVYVEILAVFRDFVVGIRLYGLENDRMETVTHLSLSFQHRVYVFVCERVVCNSINVRFSSEHQTM